MPRIGLSINALAESIPHMHVLAGYGRDRSRMGRNLRARPANLCGVCCRDRLNTVEARRTAYVSPHIFYMHTRQLWPHHHHHSNHDNSSPAASSFSSWACAWPSSHPTPRRRARSLLRLPSLWTGAPPSDLPQPLPARSCSCCSSAQPPPAPRHAKRSPRRPVRSQGMAHQTHSTRNFSQAWTGF